MNKMSDPVQLWAPTFGSCGSEDNKKNSPENDKQDFKKAWRDLGVREQEIFDTHVGKNMKQKNHKEMRWLDRAKAMCEHGTKNKGTEVYSARYRRGIQANCCKRWLIH